MKSVVIIGAGMGGLAAALRLRKMGLDVTVIEKQKRPGGRSNVLQEAGFRVDIGPTILVMKDTFEETKLSAEVERVEPGVTQRLFRFIGDSAKKYELGMDFVDRNYDHITDLANPMAGVRLVQTSAYQNLYEQVGKYFRTDKLRKAFSFHSMFLGLSPFDALAMYSLITYADLVEGMQYPMGGIYSIIEDMVALCGEMGVNLRTGVAVKEINVARGASGATCAANGVTLETGEFVPANIVVSNADLVYTYKRLIRPEYRKVYPDAKLDKMDYACSGYLLYLGVDKQYDHMRHQALYFSEDYRANLDAIFRAKVIPDDPSFHLNNPTITDPSLAPPGHSVLYLLAPMPNLQGKNDWDAAIPVIREKLYRQLEKIVDPDIRRHVVWEREYRPEDWERDINAPYGVAFGSLSQGFFQSSYFRPHNKARDIANLYFVGQATYPGIGMPMVLLSARLLQERLAKDYRL